MRSIQVSQAVVGLLGSAAGSLGILAVLVAIVPVMIPIFLIGAVPILLITARSSRLFYDFAFGMTPLERQRMYLTRVLTHRQHAHEIIAFAVAPYLTRRWHVLFDRRMSDLRKLVRRRLLLALVASAGTATLLILPVGVVAWLLLIGKMQVAQAVTAATGLIFLGPSLRQLITSATELYEVSLYLEDYEAFLKMREMLLAETQGRRRRPTLNGCASSTSVLTTRAQQGPHWRTSAWIGRGEVIALVGENGSGKLCGRANRTRQRV